MKSQCDVLKAIESYGEKYCSEYLRGWNRNKLEKNWWVSLKFFFERSFLRGRNDELSKKYYLFTIEVLYDFFGIESFGLNDALNLLRRNNEDYNIEIIRKFKKTKFRKGNGRKNSITHNDFVSDVISKNKLIEKLSSPYDKTKKVILNNDRDLMMVLDVLKFISQNRVENIYNYLKDGLTKDGPRTVNTKLDGIFGIGHKVAAFIIRDIGLLNQDLVNADFECAFPVDTWVSQVAKKYLGRDLREVGTHKDIEKLRLFIRDVLACENSIDPLKLAAGMWYVGFHRIPIS